MIILTVLIWIANDLYSTLCYVMFYKRFILKLLGGGTLGKVVLYTVLYKELMSYIPVDTGVFKSKHQWLKMQITLIFVYPELLNAINYVYLRSIPG